VANDESETPDFSNLDFSAQGSDEAGGLGDVDLTPQFEDLDDPLDDLQTLAEETDQPEPSGGDVTENGGVTESDTEQLDVLEQEEDAEAEEGEEPSKEEDERESLLTRLGRTSPYTVMLAMALVAILIAITCLFLELKQYNFDIKPPSTAAEIVHPGPPNTTAMA